MSLKGNLSSVNLTEIFQMLSLSGREGTLFIYEGPRKRAICFTKDGVSIRSRERDEGNLIGKILVRLGRIEEPDLQTAVEARRSSEKLLGDILVDMGVCTREDIVEGLRVQTEEEIQDLFLNRSDAQFEYVDGYFPESEVPYVNLNVNSLLIEIARRTDEWEYIRRRIRGPREIYRFTGIEGEVDPELLHECHAIRVDPLIDGSHSIGEIIEVSYVNKYEVCKLMAAYLDTGVIELVPLDAIRQNARLALRMGDTPSAIRNYEYLMGTGDFPLDIMGEAAEAHEANRDFAEAATLLRRLAGELVRAGDYRGALDVLRRVANYPRPEPEALRYLIDLVFENPRAAAEFAGNIVEAGKTLVAYYISQDLQDDALALLDRLIRIFPDEVAFAVSLVNVYYEEGNREQATTECERLAHGFLKRKRPSQAVSLYKKLLVIDPERQDIREKIRKIVAGRKRRGPPTALPRVAVTLAVCVLLAGVAVVFVKQGGTIGNDPSGLGSEYIENVLFPQAVEAKTSATEAGRRAVKEFTTLVDDLGDDPTANRELLLDRLRVAEDNWGIFEENAGRATSIAETIRKQASSREQTARARAMIATLKEDGSRVETARRNWRANAQKVAVKLRDEGVLRYEVRELQAALTHFELARQLATDVDWIVGSDLDTYISNIRHDKEIVAQELSRAKAAENEKDWTRARQIKLDLLREYGKADIIKGLRLEWEILTIPPGATILLDGVEMAQKTPTVVRLSPFKATEVVVRRDSFRPEKRLLGPFGTDTEAAQHQFNWSLLKTAKWTKTLQDQEDIEADPAAWHGRVAFVGRNGRWVVRDAASGGLVKKGRLKNVDGITAGIVTDGEVFFISTLDGRVFAFEAASCKYLYTLTAPKAGVYATPVIADGVFYAVDFKGNVFAFHISTRDVLWRQKVPHGVRAAPVVQGDDLVVLSNSGEVTVIQRRSGKLVARYELEGYFSCAPAPVGPNDLVFASEEGKLYAVNRTTGDIAWQKELKIPIKRTPPAKGRAVFVAPKPGELLAIDASTGDIYHRYSRGTATRETGVPGSERIFFVNGRTLSAFGPSPRGYALAWTFRAEGTILAGPVVRDRAIYIGDEKGHLYRLEAND
ncbi:MAG: outer membrane protein assembly factor BamB family protein [Planctomycetota bacterium]|jgi:outer membrane protein assembly factor BamB